jgi:hypothetical protein
MPGATGDEAPVAATSKRLMGWPSKVSPGTRMPARQCSKVDLPDPLGPMTATISPCRTPSAAERPTLGPALGLAGVMLGHRSG